jgi:uncharacterized protein (DUF362 family)
MSEALSRRKFLKQISKALAATYLGSVAKPGLAFPGVDKSQVFLVKDCPVHDRQRRHVGLDTLLDLLARNGLKLYQTERPSRWGSLNGIIEKNDIVLIKVNCQWKCRGATNTDVIRGLIHRILQHPDGFEGEVVVFENGQGVGAFDGYPRYGGVYSQWPEIDEAVYINAEEENTLTVEYLVNEVFKDFPVSASLLDPVRRNFLPENDHHTDGYRRVSDVSYPCFTTKGGHRVELKEGIWNGSTYKGNLKLINVPVFKHHGGTGITGTLKHTYGILSMADGHSGIRHYDQSGIQCGKMFTMVRPPNLNIVDCIWVSFESLTGYPPATTCRVNTLLGGVDPVALDYYASKHIFYPLGGVAAGDHNPDSSEGLAAHLAGARDFINQNGGIFGDWSRLGDENLQVISRVATAKPNPWLPLLLGD